MMFIVAIVLLTLLALLFVVWPFVVAQAPIDQVDRESENVELYRKRLAELDAQKIEQGLSSAEYTRSKNELDRDLIANNKQRQTKAARTHKAWPWLMSLILVLVSAISYWQLGANQQINLKQLWDERMQDRASLELFLTEYKRYLHKQDKDVSGWWLVARNYFTVGEFAQAEAAYREALAALQQFSEVNPEDHAEVLTKLAQSIFFQNDDFNDEVKSLLEQAISLNPNQTIALGLLGIGSFKTADYLSAIKYWRKAQQLSDRVEDKEAIAGGIENAIGQFFEQGGTMADIEALFGPQLRIRIENASQSDANVLFVVARPVGQKMPVAVRRVVVDQWPVELSLSNDYAMAGQQLESFNELEIVARLSRSGSASTQQGDWVSAPQAFAVKNGSSSFTLVIDQQQ